MDLAMAISRYFLSILVFLCFHFQQYLAGDGSLFHVCSDSANFTAGDTYNSNLNQLTITLASHAPPTGFAKLSTGKDPDRSYGFGLCRGDVSAANCRTCIREASSALLNRCPLSKAAVIWFDYCLLKYSEFNFFGVIDTFSFRLVNLNDVDDPDNFRSKTTQLLTQLSGEAYKTPRLYAEGQVNLSDNKQLYALVQCSRDLSADLCKTCLAGIFDDLKPCCDKKEGGRVVASSCNFRFEIYPFTFKTHKNRTEVVPT